MIASDKHPLEKGNSMSKYADLVVPPSNYPLCVPEINNVETWAKENNLILNDLKSVEIVFISNQS